MPTPPTPMLKRDLLKQRQTEAIAHPAPEDLAPRIAQVKKLQQAKKVLTPLVTSVGTPLHPRTADLVKRKGRVLVSEPRPFKPSPGAPPATLKEVSALGGRLRGSKTCKTPEEKAAMLTRIGRKGGLAKARKRKALIQALDKLDRKITRDRKSLLKAGVAASELD